MKFLSNLSGLMGLIAICAAIGIYVLFPGQGLLVYGVWALAGLSILAWLLLNRTSVLKFFTKKSTRYGANFAFVVFLVLGILVFANILAKEFHWRQDITRSGLNSLSSQSVKIVKDLQQDVKVYYFNTLTEKERQEPLFKNYAYHSKHFQYEFIDTARRPTFTQSMDVKRNDTVVLQVAGANKKIKVEGASEEKVTNALIQLLRTKVQNVYFTVGHGERQLSSSSEATAYSALKQELEKQGYTVKELNLMGAGGVPEDAAVVVVAGPKSAFFPRELELLAKWVKGGGRALFAVDLDVGSSGLAKGSAQIAELLRPYGVDVADKMLVDPTSQMAQVGPEILLGFSGSQSHPITKDFPTSKFGLVANFYFPITTYLTHEKKENVTVAPLAKTSQSAWAESDWSSLKSGVVKFQKEQDRQGEMDLAYAVEVKRPEEKRETAESGTDSSQILTRLAVFAASSFATDGLLDKGGNRDFFLNTVAWLVNDERFISIRPRDDGESDQLEANANVMNFVFLLTVFVLPLAMVTSGVVIWWRRSKQ